MDVPNTCYRYYSSDNFSYIEKLLSENMLYFAFPKEFHDNDAYDCKTYSVIASPDFNSDLDFIKSYYEKANFSHLPYIDKKLAMAQRIHHFGGEEAFVKFILDNLDKTTKEIWDSKRFGILCLTSNCDNREMWIKYAQNWSGFCVQFNLNLILQTLLSSKISYAKQGKGSIICNWVDYVEEPEKFKIQEYFACGPRMLFLKLKSKYNFENEIRIIIPECIDQKIVFPAGIIMKIMIGKNAKKEHIAIVKELVEQVQHSQYNEMIAGRSNNGILANDI